jgi:hypothetical protein
MGVNVGVAAESGPNGVGFPYDWIDLVEGEPITIACFYICKGASSQQVLFSQILLVVNNINILNFFKK